MKLYGFAGTPNTVKVQAVAKYANVDLEFVQVEFGKTNKTPEFLAKFPVGKIPALESPAGPIYESNAICHYIAQKNPALLGATEFERSLVIQFICLLDNEINPAFMKSVYPIYGYMPYNASQWQSDVADLKARIQLLDGMLKTCTYFVGESITIVDLIYSSVFGRVFEHLLTPEDRKKYVNFTRWYVTMVNQPNVKAVIGEVKLADNLVNVEQHLQTLKPATAAAVSHNDEEEEEEAAPKPKPKNAMDLLPPAKMNLEEWKRVYSNKDTRSEAIPWFWEKYDSEDYTIWMGRYKYNEELKKIFMTCNLVTGLFARMDAMRKYCFASVLICGEDDNNDISGVFVIRGKDMPDLMKDVPDFDCYDWTRLDSSDAQSRELINDYFAWDGALEGKQFNQGKVFK